MSTANKPVRVRISLQGGGILEDVDQIARVVVEPEDIRCERVDDEHVLISGSVRAFLYFSKRGQTEIQGEGVKIPFSRRVDASGLVSEAIEVRVEDAQSDYDYDRATGAFQHRITLLIDLVAPRQSLGSHQGESRLSQIRVGPAPPDKEEAHGSAGTPLEAKATASPEDKGNTPPEDKAGASPEDKAGTKQEPLVWKPFPPPIQ